MVLLWTCYNKSNSHSRAEHNIPGWVSQEQSGGEHSPPSTGYGWLSGVQVLTGASAYVQVFIHQYSEVLFLQGCSQSIHSPVCTDVWVCTDPGVRPWTWPWTSQGLHGPTSQACWCPSRWHLFLLLLRSVWCHSQTCWRCTWSHCRY